MKHLTVDLGERSYPIYLAAGEFGELFELLGRQFAPGVAGLVTDENVSGLYGAAVKSGLEAQGFEPIQVILPAGEENKNLTQVENIYNHMIEGGLERGSPILALGGGVVGDMAGFAAATLFRGTGLVQIPTTLLSQVDSGVGGKTGVNHRLGKNLIGCFYQPDFVFADVAMLCTLKEREYRAGLGEVVKYGVIGDAGFFAQLEKNHAAIMQRDAAHLKTIVHRCCAIKAEIVSKDERDQGLRALLNFGHTFGHAVEAATSYGRYLHGEALSLGMVMAATVSARLGLCPNDLPGRLKELLETFGLPTDYRDYKSVEVLKLTQWDKKVRGKTPHWILVEDLGAASIRPMALDEVIKLLAL